MGLESVWNEKKRWRPYAIRVSAYPVESVWNFGGKKRTLKKVFDPKKGKKKVSAYSPESLVNTHFSSLVAPNGFEPLTLRV